MLPQPNPVPASPPPPLLFPNRPPPSRPVSQPARKPPVLVWSRPPVQLELFPWMRPGPDNLLSRASLPAWFDRLSLPPSEARGVPSQPLLPRSPQPPV
jgi:hypothetical protein